MQSKVSTLIKEKLYEQKLTIPDLAARMKMSRSGLYKLINGHNMTINMLSSISVALNHNFFFDLRPLPTSQPTTPDPASLQAEITNLKQLVAFLQQENLHLKETNFLLLDKSIPKTS